MGFVNLNFIMTTIIAAVLAFCFLFSEDLKGISKVWIIGDNFMAESYRKKFKRSMADFYLKNHHEILPFCSSNFSDKNANALSQITNSFMEALNSKYMLPEYLRVVVEDDLIEYLGYKKFMVASLLGPWIEYLAELFTDLLNMRRSQLPVKARLPEKTQVYWVEAAMHENFDYVNQQARETFNNCLEANSKLHETMRILKIRDFWDWKDDSLVLNNRFSKAGYTAYWRSLDASFKFNAKKRVEFLVRSHFRDLKSRGDFNDSAKKHCREDSRNFGQEKNTDREETLEDEMIGFFRRRREDKAYFDRFHWKKGDNSNKSGNQFILLCPK